MKYFKTCRTAEDVKATYKRLAKQLHPDMGGSKEEFQSVRFNIKCAACTWAYEMVDGELRPYIY